MFLVLPETGTTLLGLGSQVVSQQKHYSYRKPKSGLQPISGLKCLKCCDSKEQQKDRKVGSEP